LTFFQSRLFLAQLIPHFFNMTSDAPVVLFHYPRSPFSYRVLSYLALRGIPYNQCVCPLSRARRN
jgi:hypothetical protein